MAKHGALSILISARELARDVIAEDEFIRRVESWLPATPPIAATNADIELIAKSHQNRVARDTAKELGVDVDEMLKSAPIAAQTEPVCQDCGLSPNAAAIQVCDSGDAHTFVYFQPEEQVDAARLEAEKKFEDWWNSDGGFYDPDSPEVPWFDKRKDLAGYAFLAGASSVPNLPLFTIAGAKCICCQSDNVTLCQNNSARWVQCNNERCGNSHFVATHPELAKFFRAASLKQETQPPKVCDYCDTQDECLSAKECLSNSSDVRAGLASSSPLETPAAANYISIADDSINGNPSCHVCGAILTLYAKFRNGMKIWDCLSCGERITQNAHATKPAETPAAVLEPPTANVWCKCPYAKDQSQEWHTIGSPGCKPTPAPADTGAAIPDLVYRCGECKQTFCGGCIEDHEAESHILASTGDTPQPQDIEQKFKEFVEHYARLNGIRPQLAVPKYDHYVEGASDFADFLAATLPAREAKEK